MKFTRFLFFVLFLELGLTVHAQVLMEFTWTLEEVNYEGLLYVPRDKPATMTVRVLDSDGNLKVLILERVEMLPLENDAVKLQCSDPKILQGPVDYKHHPEAFTAQNEARGKVSNGHAEALYEINLIDSKNIGQIVEKYLRRF